ncbi:hypothetical protein ACLB2K_004689 [Fragaria x ananassa]
MASSSSSLPLPSTDDHQNQYTYEVFLSFRGEDTRYTFTDHLHTALIRRGITTFRDDKLNRGEDISQELLKAIEESRVSIIVFSETYASSRWCLDELVHILECRRSRGQEVRPVFYRVDPSDVRNQRGAFGKAFAELDQSKYEEDKICKWRTALKEAADLSGWPYKDDVYEAKFIDDIVGELSAGVVNPSCMLHVTAHPVGLDSCREDVNRLLDLEESVVRMVGIWGAGGIGKTTISKEVFNSIHHKFEGSCFLADVRSNSNGLAQLQETLLCDVLGDSTLRVRSVDQGVGLIMTRMQRKKVLIILDDVSHSSQLEKLVPSPNCFGRGSRILITTRDRGCLLDVDQVYEVKTLNDCQAMNLFSLNAFRTIGPPSDYLVLAERAIRYAQGLPLALIVLGSHLFRRSRDEWEDTIGSCRGDPRTDIRDVLKLSYDALGEDLKEVFLDIACFFKGKCVVDVKPILQTCYGLNSGIEQLQEKALLRIDRRRMGDMIWMHDLIEEMGEEIANPEGKPDERTRLWRYDDVKSALSDNARTKKMKGIHLEGYHEKDEIYLNSKSFSKMKDLRYFFIRSINIKWSGNIDHLSNELRYLEWPKCPLQSFPSNFHPYKLVKLHISDSCHITRLWNGCKNSPNLKYMDLSRCESLREFPDLSGIPNLIELHLTACISLVEIPHSIGSLEKLEILDLQYCIGLQEFPKIIGKLDSLRELNLSYTRFKWRKEKGNRSGLKQLWLECCQNLTNLEILKLRGCSELVRFLREASISPDDDSGSLLLPKLREFYIDGCNLSTADFIGDLNCLEKLNIIDLAENNFVTLPAFSKFVNLSKILLYNCERLREIPELPPNILEVDAKECRSLERFSMLPKSLNTVKMNLVDCHRFSECLGNDMKMMENVLLNNQDSRFSLVFPGSEVPNWFEEVIATEDSWFSTVSFEIPSKLKLENIAGVVVCFVCDFSDVSTFHTDLSINGVHIHQHIYEIGILFMSNHLWVGYTPLTGEIKGKLLGQWPYKCQVEFHCPHMTSCGVHLVCQPPNENSNKMVMADEPAGESGMHTERKRPHTGANDDYHHQLEQQDQPIVMSPHHHQLEQQDQPIVMSSSKRHFYSLLRRLAAVYRIGWEKYDRIEIWEDVGVVMASQIVAAAAGRTTVAARRQLVTLTEAAASRIHQLLEQR